MNKQELAAKIWETANSLRSKIKANEYKDYILGFMFYKYLSDKEERYVIENGGTIEDLKGDSAKDMLQNDNGYFIEYNNLFSVWKEQGLQLGAATVSQALTEFNRNINPVYKRTFEDIFSTLEHGLSKLGDSSGSRDKAIRSIVDLVSDVPTTNNSYDVLGYIYEYLILKFSTISKDDGAFYTPHEVSSLMAQIIADAMKDKETINVYDPTSGSGSLLLTIGKEVEKYIDKDNIKYYGQELITETYNLTRMNLIMKGISTSNLCIRNGDTLSDDWPYFDEETAYEPLRVDAVVSNPPYSLHWNPDERENDPRFKYGLAPSGKADYAFLQHCLFHLQKDGIMAIVLPHGVLFRGASEGVIRKNLIDNNHIETIIGLPSNLFFATGIPTIIMILRKNRESNNVLFIDASQNFVKAKNQNVLRESDIKRIFDAVKERKNIDNFCRVVEKSEIIANEYNLNIPRYISATPEAEKYDLYSVMEGSVSRQELSKFDNFWNRFPSLLPTLFTQHNQYYSFNCIDIQETISNDDNIQKFKNSYAVLSNTYKEYLIDTLVHNVMSTDVNIKELITDKLFEILSAEELVDKYAAYQYLSENWMTIENDLNQIKENGINICRKVEPNMVYKKDSKTKKTNEVQDGWKGAIIPFELAQKMFFKKEFEEVSELQSEFDSAMSEATEIEDGFPDDFKEKEGNIKTKRGDYISEQILRPLNITNPSKKLVKQITDVLCLSDVSTEMLNEVLENVDSKDEIIANFEENEEFIKSLNRRIDLDAVKSEKSKAIKELKVEIDTKTKNKIETLTDEEIEMLLVEKWIMPIINGMNETCKNTIDDFIKSIVALKDKYSDNLNEINAEIHKVDEELFALMDELTGSETDMMAIQMLKDALR